MRAARGSERRKLASALRRVGAPTPLLLAAAAVIASPAPRVRADAVPEVKAYGDAGTTEVSVQLGIGSNYFAGGAGLRYFVVDGIAPGFEGSYLQSHGIGQGLAMGSVRLAPLRFGTVVPVATVRAGRVFLSNHPGGWGVGGDVGVLILASPHVALEVGYGFLHLLPESFCADLNECTIYQPTLGVRITF
jgi:hypothetical protein